ncbi:MAG: PAS domain S-box protein, partial [Burkholderiaceae bacterium]
MADSQVQEETANSAAPTGQSRLSAFADAGWLRGLIAVLAVLTMVTLVGTLTAQGRAGSAVAVLHAVTGVSLFVVLLFWLVASRSALKGMRERDRAWQQSIDSMDVGIALYGPDDRLLNCNPAFRTLYPEIADLMRPGALYSDLVHAYYRRAPAEVIGGRTLERFVADANRRRSGSEVTETVRHADGRWLLMTDCRTAKGGIISFRRDVTEQKLIEHELSHRRRLMDDLAELTYDWFWRQDADGRFIEFSRTMERFVGIEPRELMGKRRTDMPAFEADAAAYAAYCGQIERREPFPWFTYKTRGGSGQPLWIAVTGKPIFDEKGTFQGYYGAGRDVTEREETLAALRRSEERYRALTQLATEWYWEADPELRITSVRGAPEREPRMAELAQGRLLWELEGLDASLPVDWESLKRRIAARESFRDLKLKLRGDDGLPLYYEISGHPVIEEGQVIGYRGLAWDVTEREALIAKISDSEARFRALTELSSDWYWEMDEELRFTLLKRGARDTLMLADEDVLGRHQWELAGELIQPTSWAEQRATLQMRRPFRDVMVRRWMPDGSFLFHMTSGDPVFDDEGTFRGYRGIGKNITDQVRAQERIERLATVDSLTQLANRQTFDERAGRLLANA